ncbi:MAG: anaerobic ribonucleoside-triphosphate reductase activating protein, partial [Candidatus Ornithospirochaeta sp.]
MQKLTLVDFPGHPAAILFTGSCNFRCPFCHNASLVLHPEKEGVLDNGDIMEFLKKRRNMLEGVVVTGGEPTLQKDLIPFLSSIKALGYLVKLDTNGYMPDVLEAAVESGAVDYVAMDIKTSLDEYPLLTGIGNIDVSRIEKSVAYLKKGKVDHEFRTTVVEPLHHRENFEKIGRLLEGNERFFLQ